MEEEPCERQALLLSARQDLIPRPFLIEVLGEMAEFDFLQDFRGLRHASAMGWVRIGHCPSKRAVGTYGRCGKTNNFPPAAISMSPLPHGHTPARARARVLLPVPESPVTSTFSPGLMATSARWTTAVPSSRVTETSRNRRAASLPPPRAILPPRRISARSSASSASSSEATRRAEAAHSARLA